MYSENDETFFVHQFCTIQNASMIIIFSTHDLYTISNIQFREKIKISFFSTLLDGINRVHNLFARDFEMFNEPDSFRSALMNIWYFGFFRFFAIFKIMFLSKKFELEKNKICFKYLLIEILRFPGSFVTYLPPFAGWVHRELGGFRKFDLARPY